MVTHISLAEAEYILYEYAKEMMKFDEPMADFGSRFPGRLESCLQQPFQTYDGKDLYPRLRDKAAVLFYLMIKNHPFENGNKRMALVILIVFLFRNGYWLKSTNEEIYDFACKVSGSNPRKKEETLAVIEEFIRENAKKRRLVGG